VSLIAAFEQSLARHQLLDSPHTLTLAYSGGVDSQALLEVAHRVCSRHPQLSLNAIHVNHGLSQLAVLWQRHCEYECAQRNIPLTIANVEVNPAPRQSLEAVARQARYQAFQTRMEPGAILILGHHLDDQAETFLLQLKRGAGAKGLSAMSEFVGAEENSAGLNMLRPFLSCSREDIVDYAKANKLIWVEDDSNTDTRFDRNFLRQQILPEVQQRWPGFAQAVSRSARLIGEQQTLIEQTASEYLLQCQEGLARKSWYSATEEAVLNIPALLQFSLLWQKQIVRLWIQQTANQYTQSQQNPPEPPGSCQPNSDQANSEQASLYQSSQAEQQPEQTGFTPVLPSEVILNELLHQIANAKQDADIEVRCGSWVFKRFQQRLYFLPQHVVATPDSIASAPNYWQLKLRFYQGGGAKCRIPTGTIVELVRRLDDMATEGKDGVFSVVPFLLVGQVKVRVELGGFSRRFKPVGAPQSKPLKQWFKIWQVPPWHRHRIPLVFIDDELVSVGGKYLCAAYGAENDLTRYPDASPELLRQSRYLLFWHHRYLN